MENIKNANTKNQKARKAEGFFANKERIPVNEELYLRRLREDYQEQQNKKRRIINVDKWAYFPDFSKQKLMKLCDELIADLDQMGINIIGVDVMELVNPTYTEPKLVVFLPKEYRSDETVKEMIPKGVYDRSKRRDVEVELRIFN